MFFLLRLDRKVKRLLTCFCNGNALLGIRSVFRQNGVDNFLYLLIVNRYHPTGIPQPEMVVIVTIRSVMAVKILKFVCDY
ncbi:MAG: hypothetical protein LBH00_02695 [Planctomycetaceae bacterium]|nr:hypothetical protein [Planctomycetaceae bacterium]